MTSTPLDRFKHILATVCVQHPDMKLEQALLLADEIDQKMSEMVGLNTFASAEIDPLKNPEEWARVNAESLLRMPGKIHAIKEIRAKTQLGLKEAKDLCERVVDPLKRSGAGHWSASWS